MTARGFRVARYELFEVIGAGGMGSMHLARSRGPGGFARVVAAKRLHPPLAHDAEFVQMLLNEARIGAKLSHASIVQVVDVIRAGDEIIVMMDYVPGVSLSELAKRLRTRKKHPPPAVVAAWLVDVLEALSAAHTATTASGTPSTIVHRDVSPHNVLVASDGRARLTDFGIATLSEPMRMESSRRSEPSASPKVAQTLGRRGKLGYMAPEQLRGEPTSPSADCYAVAVLGWELLASERLVSARQLEEVL